ncbi:MAG: hypothetical protein ACOCP8_03875 [archaeon]
MSPDEIRDCPICLNEVFQKGKMHYKNNFISPKIDTDKSIKDFYSLKELKEVINNSKKFKTLQIWKNNNIDINNGKVVMKINIKMLCEECGFEKELKKEIPIKKL